MAAVVRAELRRLLRWPTVWVLGGSWVVLNLTFGYVFNYLTYRSDDTTGFGGGGSKQQLLAQILPDQAPVTLVQGMPMFGGALLMILGALAVGSGYGWGTWKTVFTTGPRRGTALGGTFVAIGLIVAALMLVTLVADLGAAFLVSTVESAGTSWPSLVDVGQGLGSALLIGGMWTAAGLLLGTLTRGPALAVGLGLVWALVVENLLRGVATLLGPLEAVTDVLPGTAAGSLAGAIGAVPQSDPAGTPGVQTILGGATATTLLLAYLAAFLVVSLVVTNRRDVAS
jgi:ABC-type transport system involved in multi-copper enzyme maturation permease subunit